MPWLSATFDYISLIKEMNLEQNYPVCKQENRGSRISGTCSVELELSILASKIQKIEKYLEQ